MIRREILGTGVFFLLIALALYIVPVNPAGHNAYQMNTLCGTDLFQLGQLGSSEISQLCRNANLIIIGIYAFLILGVVLVIIGVVFPKLFKDKASKKKTNALHILEERYAKGEITKEEFDKMKGDLS
jgi:putative membrane protein